MNISSVPEKPLIVGTGKIENAMRVYFFERPDGSRIFVLGKEAWNLYTKPQQILGFQNKRFKFLGSSDGTAHQKAVMESQQIFRDTKDYEKARERLRQGEEEEFNNRQNIPPMNYDKVDMRGNPTNLLI